MKPADILQTELGPTQSVMAVMNELGDKKTIWDRANAVEVEAAKIEFTFFKEKGYMAYKVEGKEGRRGEILARFRSRGRADHLRPTDERRLIMPTYSNANVLYCTATASTASSTATTIVTWGAWNQEYSNATQTSSGCLGAQAAAYGSRYGQQQGLQYAANDADFLAQHEAARELDRQAAESSKRATALLIQHLDKAQVADFRANRQFIVHSRDGVRRYRVDYGRAGNVKLLGDGDRVVAKFCIHPDSPCPNEDVMLAQKLMLETDEEEFLRIANRIAVAA